MFFLGSPNELPRLAPAFARLAGVLRVVDVRAASAGKVLRVLLDGEHDEAVGVLAAAATEPRLDPRA